MASRRILAKRGKVKEDVVDKLSLKLVIWTKGIITMLPKPKKVKLINVKEFEKNAKKVRESFEEEAKYIREKRMKYGNNISSDPYCFT